MGKMRAFSTTLAPKRRQVVCRLCTGHARRTAVTREIPVVVASRDAARALLRSRYEALIAFHTVAVSQFQQKATRPLLGEPLTASPFWVRSR